MKPLTSADFTPLVNQKFKVTVTAGDEDTPAVEAELELASVTDTCNDTCEGFSLIFHGPAEKVLRQRTYPVQNPTLGEREIFLVPIAPDEKSSQGGEVQRYQALFNRLQPAVEAANPLPLKS